MASFSSFVHKGTTFSVLTSFFISILFLSSFAMPALAAPQGGQVVAGQGQISQDQATTTVLQQSNALAIDWESFNISSHETVSFQQPSSSSVVLNRIVDQDPTQIFGSIRANGRVFLSNPNGIIFGQSATINTGSFVAAGLNINVDDFMQGRYHFIIPSGQSGGIVINRGLIAAATGGSVSLIGGSVRNEGMILASLGQVNLGAGRKAVIDFDGDGLIHFEVSEALLKNEGGLSAAVNNNGQIKASGGEVLLTATAAQDVFKYVVNNEGLIEAGRIDNSGGRVRLVGIGSDPVIHSGVIDVSGQDAQSTGGTVHVLGKKVGLFDDASINASGDAGGGTVLIGGDFQGKNPDIQNAKLSYVSAGSTLFADALISGDGGKVIVWADETTRFFGKISAQGGEHSGDGGFAEVSGAQYLDYQGLADLRALNGAWGTLLLDPANLSIVALADSNVTPVPTQTFEPNPLPDDASVLNVATLVTALGNGNVTVRTGDPNTAGSGILSVDTAIKFLGATPSTLTLQSHDQIIINASITGDNLNLELQADVVSGGIPPGRSFIELKSSIDVNSLSIIGTSVFLLLGGNITVDTNLDLRTNVSSIALTGNVTIDTAPGGFNQFIQLANVTGDHNLTLRGDGGSTLSLGVIDVNKLAVSGGALNLNGNITVDTNLDLRTNVSSIALLGNVTIDTAAGGFNQFVQLANVTGDHNLTLRGDGGSTLSLAVVDTNQLVVSGGVLNLDGNITVDASLDLRTNISIIILRGDVTIDTAAGGFNQFIKLANVTRDHNLTLRGDGGSALTLGVIDTNQLVVSGGALTLNGNITVDTSLDLRTNISSIALLGNVTIDTAAGGFNQFIQLANVTGNHNLTLTGDGGSALSLGGVDTNQLVVSGGALTLNGNITVDTNLDLRTNISSIALLGNVTIDTAAGDFNQFIQLANVTGNHNLTLTGDGGSALSLGGVDTNQLVVSGGALTLNGNITVDTDLDLGTNISSIFLLGDVTIDTAAGGVNQFIKLAPVSGNTKTLTLNAGGGNIDLGLVSAAAGLKVTSSGTTTLTGNIITRLTNQNAFVDFSGATKIILGGTGTRFILSNKIDLNGGDVDGDKNLQIEATGGIVSLGSMGQNTPLNSLTVVGSIGSGSVKMIHLSGDITTVGNLLLRHDGIFFSNPTLDLTGPVTIKANEVTFPSSPITGGQNLTIKTSQNFSFFGGAFGTLTLETAGRLLVASPITATGSIELKANNFDIRDTITSNGGAGDITVIGTDPEFIIGADIISVGPGNEFRAAAEINSGEIAFFKAANLTLSASNGRLVLKSFAVDFSEFNTVILDANGVNGEVVISSENRLFVGNGFVLFSTGTASFKSLTVTADKGIRIVGKVETTVGDLNLDAGAGGFDFNVNELSANGGLAFAGGLTLKGAQGLKLSNTFELTASGAGNIDLGGVEINSSSAGASAELIVNSGSGRVTLGNIGTGNDGSGGSLALSSVVVNTTGVTELKGDITTKGTGVKVVGSSGILLSSNVTIDTSTGGGVVDFGTTALDGAHNFTVKAGTGSLTLGAVGQNTPLRRLTVSSAGTISFGGAMTLGALTITQAGLTTLNGDITTSLDDDLSIASEVKLGRDLIMTTTANTSSVILNKVDGPHSLTIRAGENITLGQIGTDTSLTGLDVSGKILTLKGDIKTNLGTVDFSKTTGILLESNVTIDTGGTIGDINFGQSDVNSDVKGTHALTMAAGTGIVSFGKMGADTALQAIAVNSAAQINLSENTTLKSTGPITLDSATLNGNNHTLSVDAGGSAVSFAAIEALGSLKVVTSGTTTLKGNITTTELAGLDLSGSDRVVFSSASGIKIDTTTNNGAVKLNGGTVDGAVDLSIDSGSGDVHLTNLGQATNLNTVTVLSTGTTTLSGDIKTQNTGGINLSGAKNIRLSGAVNLVASSGDIDIAEVNFIGAGASSLAASGNTLNLGGTLTTEGMIDFQGMNDISLKSNTTLNSTNNAINLRATKGLQGTFALTVNSGTGDITLGEIGQQASPLTSLLVISTGTTQLGGNIVTNGIDGINLSQASNVDLSTDVVMDSAAGDGKILLNGGALDGAFALTLKAGAGDVILGGGGTRAPLASLNVTNTGKQTYNGNLRVSGSLILNGGSIVQNAGLSSTGGVIDVKAASGITMASAASTTSGGGTITYTATTGDILLGLLDTKNGNVLVDALGGGSIVQNAGLSSTGGAIDVKAASGITMASAASTTSGGGAITYTTTTGDILLGLLDAKNGNVLVDTLGGGSILNNRGSLRNIAGDFTNVVNIKGNKATLRSASRIGVSAVDAITIDASDFIELSFGATKAFIRNVNSVRTTVVGGGEVFDVIQESRNINKKSESALRQEFAMEEFNGEEQATHLYTVNSPGFGTATEMGAAREISILNPVVPRMLRLAEGWRFLRESEAVERTGFQVETVHDNKNDEKRSQRRQKYDKKVADQFKEGFKYSIDPFSSKERQVR